jgi:hypothetical protein
MALSADEEASADDFPVLIISATLLPGAILPGVIGTLAKPFDIEDLHRSGPQLDQEVLTGHRSHDPIEENQARTGDAVGVQLLEGVTPVARGEDSSTGVLDRIGEPLAHVVIVLDHKDGLGATSALAWDHH